MECKSLGCSEQVKDTTNLRKQSPRKRKRGRREYCKGHWCFHKNKGGLEGLKGKKFMKELGRL